MNSLNYRDYVESSPNFPKEGVLFWDFTPLLKDPRAFKAAITDIARHYAGKSAGITKIAAIEAKGFVLGGALAFELGKPLVLIRKPGLTPGSVAKKTFVKEYGTAEYEMSLKSVSKGDHVLLVYDILAAPGATEAAIALVEGAGASVVGCVYVIELEYLKGREALGNIDLFSLVKIHEKRADG